MMEDHSDSFYPGEEFVFITTKPEELPVPWSEADPHKSDNTQAETFEKDPFVAILGWDSSDTTSLSAVSPDRVRNPGKDPDIPDCSRLHQSKILSFLVHNTITFVARFMADYGEYGSMMVDVGHADTLLATDFPFTKTASKLDQYGGADADISFLPCYFVAPPPTFYGTRASRSQLDHSRTGPDTVCRADTEVDLYRELHIAQVSFCSVLLPPALLSPRPNAAFAGS